MQCLNSDQKANPTGGTSHTEAGRYGTALIIKYCVPIINEIES
jgi:hypothetical protein